MKTQVDKINEFLTLLKSHEKINKLFRYFNNEKYLIIFIKQIEQLSENILSIKTLTEINNIEDAYCIYRKFLETFFILMSVIKHPKSCGEFLKHNEYVSKKVIDRENSEIKALRESHIDGYIEYGYLLPYINYNPKKLSMFDVAKAGEVSKFFNQYKICNNFVHNNLNLVRFDKEKAKKELDGALKEITSYLVKKVSSVL